LNFKVEVKVNLTRNGIKTAVLDFVENLENNCIDMCVLCVMSHGEENVILGSDGLEVDIKLDIFNRFSNKDCPSMIGKPKLFILQACRGPKRDRGLLVRESIVKDSVRIASILEDAIIAYACIPGYGAWRQEDLGSYFITILCQVFKEFAAHLEIQDLFKIVTKRMKEVNVGDEKGECKTTPEVRYRIDKDLYFQPRLNHLSKEKESAEKYVDINTFCCIL
jgi:hypothetical protein